MSEQISHASGGGGYVSGVGLPLRRIRMTDELWEQFGEAVAKGDPELDRSKVIRQFVRWFSGLTDELPHRPEPPKRGHR